MLSIEILDLSKIDYDESGTIIPFAAYPGSRVRIDTNRDRVVVEYAQVNYYWNDILQKEEEEWTWCLAYHQPDVEEQKKFIKELEGYAENEALLQSQMC